MYFDDLIECYNLKYMAVSQFRIFLRTKPLIFSFRLFIGVWQECSLVLLLRGIYEAFTIKVQFLCPAEGKKLYLNIFEY